MTSAEMLKSKIKANEYFHNKASLGKKPDWVVLRRLICADCGKPLQFGIDGALKDGKELCYECFKSTHAIHKPIHGVL